MIKGIVEQERERKAKRNKEKKWETTFGNEEKRVCT